MSKFVLTAQLQLQAPTNVGQVVQQIQNQLNGVTVNVQVKNAAKAQQQIQQVAQATNQATTAAERMGKAFALSVRRFAAFSIATRAVSLFTSNLSAAVDEAISFERQLIKVAQVTGKSISQLKGLTRQITSLSTGFGVASKDLLEVSTVLSQAGLTAEDTAVALKTLAKAALAPNFDSMSETAEGAIAILAQFQEGVGALERQLGSINAVAGAFAVEASDLIDVVRRTGGVFKASGGSLNELLALFTSVRATTRESAESIGTGLRTIFTRIQRPKTIEFLKQFGVELTDLNGKFIGPYEAIKRLSEALAGLGEGDIRFIQIAEELGGFRQIGKVLPLLQQFSTAQSALNVATKAGNSLTSDATTAQQALAIRITKVKEEFLALVRSITETTTFQVMANTALSLASALIKIGDAIKPLLPLMAAMAAIKLTRGFGGFFGGIMKGMTSAKQFGKGGKVHAFAHGGLVPGTGNRDTVPAMLSPGEFVIRKSSVAKIGANNLAGINKYAAGGIVTNDRHGYGPYAPNSPIMKRAKNSVTATRWRNMTQDERQALAAKQESESPLAEATAKKKQKGLAGEININPSAIGGFFLRPNKGTERDYNINRKVQLEDGKYALKGKINGFYTGKNDLAGSSIGKIVREETSSSLRNSIKNVATTVQSRKLVDVPPIYGNENIFERSVSNLFKEGGAQAAIEGYMLEGLVSALSGATLAGGKAAFDYPSSSLTPAAKGRLASIFRSNAEVSSLIKADAKRTGSPDNYKNIGDKLVSDIREKNFEGLTVKKFATGGNVGTDTVPALLTPGEFVVNRSSAQRIGYGNLNRMNKVGKYAKGGIVNGQHVQRFFEGGKSDEHVARAQGSILNSISEAEQVFDSLLGEMAPAIKAAILDGWKGIGQIKSTDVSASGKSREYTRGIAYGSQAMAFQVKGKKAAATTETVAHETGHLADYALGGKKGYASEQQGTFQFDLIEKLKPQMVEAFKRAGKSADEIENYLSKNKELFAEFYAKASPEVRAILTSTTDSKVGMEKLAASLGDAGSTYAGLQASDIVPPQTKAAATSKASTASKPKVKLVQPGDPATGAKPKFTLVSPTVASAATSAAAKQTQASKMGLSTADVIAKAKSQKSSGGSKSSTSQSADTKNSNAVNTASLAVIAGLTAILPPLDENASAATRMGHSLIGLIATIEGVSAAMKMFGLDLNKKSGKDFLSGKGLTGQGKQSVYNQVRNLGGSKKLAGNVTGVVNGLAKLAGPLVAIAGSAYIATKAMNSMIDSFYDFDGVLKRAIEKGDVAKAEQAASNKSLNEGADIVRGAGATAGAAVGFFFGGPIGAAIGAAIGVGLGSLIANLLPESALDTINVMFGGNTRASAMAMAAAQAGAIKTQKELDKAQKVATEAMSDFERGAITASEALSRVRSSTSEVENQRKRADKAARANTANLAEGGMTGRNVMAALSFGLVESSTQRNQRLGKENASQINEASKFQQQAFDLETPARQAAIRSATARGKSDADIRKLSGVENLRSQRSEQLALAMRLSKAGDQEGSDAAKAAADQLTEQIKQVEKEMVNIKDAVKRAKESFEALNLGLRPAMSTATALSSSLTRFAQGLEVGGSTFESDVAFLQQSLSSAAAAMNPNDIKDAISNVSNNLRKFGVSGKYITKFEDNMKAFTQAQINYNSAVANIKKKMGEDDFKQLSAKDFQAKLADELANGLGKDVSKEAKDNLRKVVMGMELSDADVEKIMESGDLSPLSDKLSEAQSKMLEDVIKISQERTKAEQVLINLTNKRIEAERHFVEAQREAVDLMMEGRELQAKYGGKAVSKQEKTNAILAKANAGASRLGLSNMKTGDAGSIRQRTDEIRRKYADIESRRRVQGGMEGEAGARADAAQQDLDKEYRSHIDTVRSLIKLEEEQLKITAEKNRLEKDSLESLVKGDIESFFRQQAGVGATAAIATGDQRLMNLYGAEALGTAALDIQRQKDAGVDSLFGQQLGGAGGLAERSAGAALSARGVTDARAAQVMAGTTAEEQASQARLRALGEELGALGEAGVDMAEMKVETAVINVTEAKIKMDDIINRGEANAQQAQAQGLARGGIVYANRGIFIPRGTDTVPAMLTPGEFVVNRAAVQRGNNLHILQSMNRGSSATASNGGTALMAKGGVVRYRSGGSNGPESGDSIFGNFSKFISAMSNFSNSLSSSIDKLANTNISIKLDSTNVNINLNDNGLLSALTGQVKNEIFSLIEKEFRIDNNGQLKRSPHLV